MLVKLKTLILGWLWTKDETERGKGVFDEEIFLSFFPFDNGLKDGCENATYERMAFVGDWGMEIK